MDTWVCPNDRQLVLRARSMLKRLENLTLSSAPSSKSACTLCGQEFGLLSKSANHCADCGRLVCPRCSKEFTEGRADRTPGANQTEVNEISPSRYLPPETASRMSSTERSMLLLRKFWQAHQATEKRDIRGQPLSSANGVGGGGDITRLTRHPFRKSFSNERPSRLSQLFGSESFSTTSNLRASRPKRYHLCKLCCEAREIWKRSGAWFHKSLPRCKLYSCPPSPLGTTMTDGQRNMLLNSPSDLVPSFTTVRSRSDDWTRVEHKKSYLESTTQGTRDYVPGAGPVSDAKIPSFQGQTSTENTISSAFDLESPGSADGIRHVPSKESINCNPIVLHQQQLHCPSLNNTQKNGNDFAQISSAPSTIVTRSPRRATNASDTVVMKDSKIASIFPEAAALSLPPPSFTLSNDFGIRKGMPVPPKSGISMAEAPLGILYFSILRDVGNAELHVKIQKAKSLIAMDANGLSDPFVVCQLLPVTGKRFRTRTIPQNLNPMWNETFVFTDFDNRKLEKRVLRFAVLDEDKFGADWLGEYRLGLGDLLPDRLSEFAVPLNPRKPLPKEIDDLVNPTKGRIQIALRYIEENKQLCVEVIRCADLAQMDHSGSSDPFVKLYLRPDKLRKTKQKTKIKKSTLFPEFNEVFYYAMDAADVDKRTLEITVWDYDRGTTNDFIGGVTLGAKGKAERREVWQAVFRPPYRRFEAWFQLASKSEPDGESNQSARVPTPGITD
uniref:Rabphilin-3A n=1 Tax=Schistocephalus solidus TaxID=70667 RepID=A0A0X3NUJ0_SCHSO